jgi:hypothetical protein
MEIEKYIRYPARAVGLKPSARECEARLRGRERNNYAKIIRPRLDEAKPPCAGESGIITQRSYALG